MGPEFRPGLYQHYKGGLYAAYFLVTHHGTRQPMVFYVCLSRGGTNVRPLNGWEGDSDGWNDLVNGPGGKVPRFRYIGELPSDTPAAERV